jgi:hypothetical protein
VQLPARNIWDRWGGRSTGDRAAERGGFAQPRILAVAEGGGGSRQPVAERRETLAGGRDRRAHGVRRLASNLTVQGRELGQHGLGPADGTVHLRDEIAQLQRHRELAA